MTSMLLLSHTNMQCVSDHSPVSSGMMLLLMCVWSALRSVVVTYMCSVGIHSVSLSGLMLPLVFAMCQRSFCMFIRGDAVTHGCKVSAFIRRIHQKDAVTNVYNLAKACYNIYLNLIYNIYQTKSAFILQVH